MRLSAINLKGLIALVSVLAVPTGSALAQQFEPYGYTSQQSQQPYVPQYTAMAAQQPGRVTIPGYNIPGYNHLESVPPGPMQWAPQPSRSSASMQPSYRIASGQAANQPNPSYESYPAASPTGNTGPIYDTFNGGCGPTSSCGNVCYSGYNPCAPRRHWFGGVYGLLMDRVGGSDIPLVFATSTPGVGYYPTDSEIVMTTADIDNDVQGGAEFRFGATCAAHGGSGGYGGCGDCGCGCGPLAWEVAYWGLAEETTSAVITDLAGDGERTYGMVDFRGLVFNGRPVNDYFDYGPPTTDNSVPYDIEIREICAHNTFSAQNVELNLLRLPLLGGGFPGCGSCDACSGGACGGCGPRCQLTTLVGARFMQFDEDFWLRSDYERMDTNAFGSIAYNIEARNQLIGFQLGANGAYYMGCGGRFACHCSTNAGIYANHIEVSQWMQAPTAVTVNPTGEAFYSDSDTDEVAFLGELRAGLSYQFNSNYRFYAGYRALGVTGVALTANQIPGAFSSLGQIGYINCNGSLFLHGLQSGLEFSY